MNPTRWITIRVVVCVNAAGDVEVTGAVVGSPRSSHEELRDRCLDVVDWPGDQPCRVVSYLTQVVPPNGERLTPESVTLHIAQPRAPKPPPPPTVPTTVIVPMPAPPAPPARPAPPAPAREPHRHPAGVVRPCGCKGHGRHRDQCAHSENYRPPGKEGVAVDIPISRPSAGLDLDAELDRRGVVDRDDLDEPPPDPVMDAPSAKGFTLTTPKPAERFDAAKPIPPHLRFTPPEGWLPPTAPSATGYGKAAKKRSEQ